MSTCTTSHAASDDAAPAAIPADIVGTAQPVITPAMREVIRLRPLNPGVRLAASRSGSSVGIWSPEHMRFIAIQTQECRGGWVRVWGLPLINGQPAIADRDWME